MKIIIDEQVCLRHKLTLDEVIAMLAVRYSSKKDIDNLIARGILTEEHGKYLFTSNWSDVLDKILRASGTDMYDEERLKALAKRMQQCFPEGKMPGTPYYYRCNSSEIVRKLRKFFERHGDYSDDKIVEATKRFVASFQGKYKYLPLLKYFISKIKTVQDEDGNFRNSEYFPLADFLENEESEEAGITDNDDWLMSTRN